MKAGSTSNARKNHYVILVVHTCVLVCRPVYMCTGTHVYACGSQVKTSGVVLRNAAYFFLRGDL